MCSSRFATCLVESDGSLDGTLVPHRLQTLLPLIQSENLIHDAGDLDLIRVKVVDGSGELVSLREAAEDCDFVTDCIGY